MDGGLAAGLDDARREYSGRDVIAFVGQAGSGRTVVAALLRHTLTTYWDPKFTGVHGSVIRGRRALDSAMLGMRNGMYPDETLRDGRPEIRIRLRNLRRDPGDWEIAIDGARGEGAVGLLSAGGPPGRVLEAGMGHLLLATKYVLVVDCTGRGTWDGDGPMAAAAVEGLARMRDIMPDGGGAGPEVAVLFTKADALPEMRHVPAGDLLESYGRLRDSLRANGARYVARRSHISHEEGAAGRIRYPFECSDAEYTALISWMIGDG